MSAPRFLLALAMASAVLLGGCRSDGGEDVVTLAPDHSPAATPTPTTIPSTTPTPTTLPSTTPTLPAVSGAVQDLTGFRCTPDAHGVWSGSGRLSNPSQAGSTYRVQFAVIDPDTSDLLGMRSVRVRLAGGASREVNAPRIVTGHARSGECVPRVTIHAAGGD